MHRGIDVVAGYAWRLIVIGIAAVAALWLIAQLWVLVAALIVAVFLTRILAGPARHLRRRLPNAVAAAVALLGFLLFIALILAALSALVANEVDDIGPTASRAVDDVEDWLVDDSPFDIDRGDIDDFRSGLGDRIGSAARDSSGSIVSGAIVVAEATLSILLALILTFFALKDGDRLLDFVRGVMPAARSDLARRMGERAWRTLGGYLRGAAMLGIVEGIVIGVTLWLVGAELAAAMAMLTFMSAFVPFAGAIFAGALAVLVALATGGVVPALIVLAVAFTVQQLDNDLLAPVVYGRALEIHPVVILLSITAGGALFGIPGSLLAVPVAAVAWNVIAEARVPSSAAAG